MGEKQKYISISDIIEKLIPKKPLFIYFFQYEQLSNKIYEIQWYLLDKSTAKSVMFVMNMTQSPIHFTFGSFLLINMNAFVAVSF